MKTIHPEIVTHLRLVQQAIQANNPEIALQYATKASSIATQHNDAFGYDIARLCVAASYTALKQYQQAIPLYQEVWESVELHADDSIILWMYIERIKAYQGIGDWENSFLYNYKGIESAKEKKADSALMELSYYISLSFERLGQYSQALQHLNTAIALAKKLGEKELLVKSLSMYANILFHALNNRDSAHEIYQEVLLIARETGNHFLQSVTTANIAAVHPQPQSEEVRALLEESLAEARQSGISFAIATTLMSVGNWYMAQKNYSQAKSYYEELLRVAKKSPHNSESCWLAYFCLANMYWAQKKYQPCRTNLQKATHYLTDQFYASEKLRTYELWYRVERASRNNDAALQWLEKVHETEQDIAAQQQAEAAQTILIVAKVETLLQELEKERQRSVNIHATIEQQQSAIVSMSQELEQKRKALQKIKQIAANAIEVKKNEESRTINEELTVEEVLREFLYNLGDDEHSWERFRENLERVHPLFMKRLIEHCPELSPMQIRICSLLRLQLSSKEIATILHLSKKTIDNHREHIRIKLNIPRSVNLTAYILNI